MSFAKFLIGAAVVFLGLMITLFGSIGGAILGGTVTNSAAGFGIGAIIPFFIGLGMMAFGAYLMLVGAVQGAKKVK